MESYKCNTYGNDMKFNIYKNLDKKNLKVNKIKFDKILDTILKNLRFPLNNKEVNCENILLSLHEMFTQNHHYELIEAFNKNSNFINYDNNVLKINAIVIVLIVVIIIILYLLYFK